jgi:hypothetical protein
MVLVSEDYLAFLHDQLAENQARLRELLGESQAQAIFCISADRLISTVGVGRYEIDSLDGILQKLSGWGMDVKRKDRGDVTELEIKCPYAERVHPRIKSQQPKCPLSEYVFGAVRLENAKSQMLRNELTHDGVTLKIRKSS